MYSECIGPRIRFRVRILCPYSATVANELVITQRRRSQQKIFRKPIVIRLLRFMLDIRIVLGTNWHEIPLSTDS